MRAGWRLAGKCILVTGATRGIGEAIARACAEAGAHLALTDVLPEVATTADQLSRDFPAVSITAMPLA